MYDLLVHLQTHDRLKQQLSEAELQRRDELIAGLVISSACLTPEKVRERKRQRR